MQKLTAFLSKKDREYFAVCPELQLQTHGRNIEEALEHLLEEMEDYYLEEVAPEEVEVDFLGWKH